MLLERLGSVRRRKHHVVDPGGASLGKLVGQKWDAGRRQHRLRGGQRQRAQSGAPPADQHNRVDAALPCLAPPQSLGERQIDIGEA